MEQFGVWPVTLSAQQKFIICLQYVFEQLTDLGWALQMYRASLHCFSCDGLRLCVKQSWNCHSFHLNIWGETGETLGHTELSFSLNLCLQIRSVSPSRDGRMECKQGNSMQHKGWGMGKAFFTAFSEVFATELAYVQFLCLCCLRAEMGSRRWLLSHDSVWPLTCTGCLDGDIQHAYLDK